MTGVWSPSQESIELVSRDRMTLKVDMMSSGKKKGGKDWTAFGLSEFW